MSATVGESVAIPVKPRPSKIGSSLTTHLLDVEQRVRNPQDVRRRFTIPNVLPTGPCFLYGPSGSGKSGLAITIAIAVASGQPWAGIEIAQGAVLYIPAEDKPGIEERLVAARENAGLDPEKTHVSVVDFHKLESLSGARDEGRQVEKRLELPVALVIVDTFGAAYGDKSQDDAGPASEMMNRLDWLSRELKCCVLAIHHTGKGGSRSAMRGSQVFFDRADAVLRIDGKGGTGTVEVEKLRNGRSGAAFKFAIGGHDLTTSQGQINVQVVRDVQPLTEDDRKGKDERIERAALNAADVAFAILQGVAKDGNADIEEWRIRCDQRWAEKKPDSQKKAFFRAKKDLEAAGKVAVDGKLVTILGTWTGTSGTCPSLVPNPANDERDKGTGTSPPSIEGVSCPMSPDPRTGG